MDIIDGNMSIIIEENISRGYAKLLFSRKNWKCFSEIDFIPIGRSRVSMHAPIPLKIRGFISLT